MTFLYVEFCDSVNASASLTLTTLIKHGKIYIIYILKPIIPIIKYLVPLECLNEIALGAMACVLVIKMNIKQYDVNLFQS